METDEGFDRETWRALNDQLGVSGVHIPEAYGGQGFGFVELGIVLEEMGRALFCGPYFASAVLAGTAILNGATEGEKNALLPGIASGETIATSPSPKKTAAGTSQRPERRQHHTAPATRWTEARASCSTVARPAGSSCSPVRRVRRARTDCPSFRLRAMRRA